MSYQGVPIKTIQAICGHASITTTLNTYASLLPSSFEGFGERIDEALNLKCDEASAKATA